LTGRKTPQRPGEERPGVKRVGMVLRPERDLHDAVEQIGAWAAETGVALVGAEGEPRLPDNVARRPEASLAAECDAVLALGGDGTMLGALRVAAPHGVPVLGVNLGTLGYLTEVDATHLGGALAALGHGDFTVEARTRLKLEDAMVLELADDGRAGGGIALVVVAGVATGLGGRESRLQGEGEQWARGPSGTRGGRR
jgi:NAD+ kinase